MKRIILLLLLMICVSVFSILYPAISTIQGGGTNDDPPLYSTTKQLGDGGKEVKVYYDADKTLKRSVKYFNNGLLHRVLGPAVTTWYGNGKVESREYYIRGVLHKDNGPALVRWDDEGGYQSKDYYENGRLISAKAWRPDGEEIGMGADRIVKAYYDPAKKVKRSVKYLNQQDQVHREIGPAITTWHGNGQLESRAWYINGSLKKSNFR